MADNDDPTPAEQIAKVLNDAGVGPAYVGDPRCRCGHVRSIHFHDTGNCMLAAESDTWACMCTEFEEREP